MKTKFIFSVIIIVSLCTGKVNSQIDLSTQKAVLITKDKVILEQHLKEYATFTIDKREIINTLRTNGTGQFRLHIDEQQDWTLDLQLNDMRAPDYKQTYISDKGKFEYESYHVNTFKGTTSTNQIARFTIDENNFFGVILDEKFHYVIRPAKDYTKNSLDESLIVYKSSDIIFENEIFDYIHDALIVPDDGENENEEESVMRSSSAYTPCTYYLKIATDADYGTYQGNGSNLTNTYGYVFSILNIVEGFYESTFNLRFIITYQNVWTTTSNGYPYTQTATCSDLLSQFRNYWNSNMTEISRNIAHLFTAQLLGCAWIGRIDNPTTPITNNSYAYGLSPFWSITYKTVTHEIGHNLNALDANLMYPVPPECLCGNDFRSIMCQGYNISSNLWFCQTSIDQISPFLASRSAFLTGSFPNNLTLNGTVSGFNKYQATQKITSNQVVNSGYTIYKAPEVELGNNFEVKLGAEFEIIIDDNGCP